MNLSIKSKKIVASVMALSLVSSGVIASESSVISKFVSSNSISASATVVYGDWEYEVTGDYTAKLVKYNGNDENISIPQGIDGHSITELGEKLFMYNTTVKSVIIPRGIQTIPAYCFTNASELESVVMPLGIRTIERSAFARTKSLKSIALPISVETIESFAFNDSGITSINMKNVKTLDNYTFKGCTNLRNVVLPAGLTSILENTFENCCSIESITFPETLTTIGKYAFKNCTNLESVDFPESLTTINNEAFRNCSSIKEVVFPESITTIGASSFKDCESLTCVSFPHFKAGMLQPNCFYNCASLENINTVDFETLDDVFANYYFGNCKNLLKVNNEYLFKKEDDSEPKFNVKYDSIIKKNFAEIDAHGWEFFNKYLDAEIKYVVATNITDDMSDVQKIKKLHDWLLNKVNYAYVEKNNSLVPDPSGQCNVDSSVFFRDTTVCDGYARALTLLLNEADIEAYYILSTKTDLSEAHAWTMVRLGDHYFHIDATHNDGGNGYDHFFISDSKLQKTCYMHSSWGISKPTQRYKYAIPKVTPECQYSVGDVNMDGFYSSEDADLIDSYVDGEIDSIDLVLADTNYDGIVDKEDSACLRAHRFARRFER